MSGLPEKADVVIVGGGFYGLCLALFYRSVVKNVVVLEEREQVMSRASFVNQARVHTGFHYPRSFVTARRSLALHRRFMEDFSGAVVDDFRMLYAVARQGSKITADRFERMYSALDAPFRAASAAERALFNPDLIDAVYSCEEAAFDAGKLGNLLMGRLHAAGIPVLTGARVTGISAQGPEGRATVAVAGQGSVTAPVVIDATYGQLGARCATPNGVRLKFEVCEVALVQPPEEIASLGVTVIDGPFFSTMPFPAQDCYSLTHVRYTPQQSWTSDSACDWPVPDQRSQWLHMARDAARYMPCMARLRWQGSLYEIKSVLLRNEGDDGRPILLSRDPRHPGIMSVLGGKLDNIYDLFEALMAEGAIAASAHDGFVAPRGPLRVRA